MTHSARLAAAGLTLPEVAAPVGSYVPALRYGDLVTTSGQLPFVDGALQATGIVGADGGVTAEVAAACARTAVLNAIAAAASAAGGIDAITQVVKVTGFVASAPSFVGQPAVVNGASDVLTEVFGDAGRHARSAVGVASLPLGAPVEIELTVAVKP
ncbi:RidA family protein [Demequina sp.]|uniref:RidA family protein n=1 Tax=Demequina sp. TaxID=2050685 RepID=UPI0025BD3944|nr:RidA family protein [Demequina sp.]